MHNNEQLKELGVWKVIQKTHDCFLFMLAFQHLQKFRGSDSRKKYIKFNWIICNNHKFIDWKTDSLFLFKVKFGWNLKSHSSRKKRYNVATEKEILEFNHKKVREGRKKINFNFYDFGLQKIFVSNKFPYFKTLEIKKWRLFLLLSCLFLYFFQEKWCERKEVFNNAKKIL